MNWGLLSTLSLTVSTEKQRRQHYLIVGIVTTVTISIALQTPTAHTAAVDATLSIGSIFHQLHYQQHFQQYYRQQYQKL